MKYIKYIDDAGRIVLPKEIRTYFKIKTGDPLCIEVLDQTICIQKDSLNEFKDCIKQILSLLQEHFNFRYWVCSRDEVLSSNLNISFKININIDDNELEELFLEKGYQGVVSFIRVNSIKLGILYLEGENAILLMEVIQLLLENELAIC